MDVLGQRGLAAVVFTSLGNDAGDDRHDVQDGGPVGRVSLNCHGAIFDVHAAPPPSNDEGHSAVLEALASQSCLVKTLANEYWIEFIHQLQGARFRTSTSLPPPLGKGMRLFGSVSAYSIGVIWDRSRLDLSEAFIWPSGYFAKSDHNIDADGLLLNGREAALVALGSLVDSNDRKCYRHQLTHEEVFDDVLPYNEVCTYVHGAAGIVGLFVRCTELAHLLWAMGIRSLLQRTLPAVGELPLFVHDAADGMQPISRAAQTSIVRRFLECSSTITSETGQLVGVPCMPIDTNGMSLTALERLRLHGAYGLTQECLVATVHSLEDQERAIDGDQAAANRAVEPAAEPRRRLQIRPATARRILLVGLHEAVGTENAGSATSLVRLLAPTLYESSGVMDMALAMRAQTSASRVARSHSPPSQFCGALHHLCSRSFSRGVMVAIGCLIALEDFASGSMLPRIAKACHQMETWLANSESLLFRLGSWAELVQHAGPGRQSVMSAFLTKHAVDNRRVFHDDLVELEKFEEARDTLHGMQHLRKLIGHLHHPCLRLEILQRILGLDPRFDLQSVAEVASMALNIIANVPGDTLLPEGASVFTENSRAKPYRQLEAAALHLQGLPHPEVDVPADAKVIKPGISETDDECTA